MFEIRVETGFRAQHAVRLGGGMEQTHTHDWRVTVAVAAPALNEEGIVMDFLRLRELADQAIAGLVGSGDLNASEALAGANPTAERVAQTLAEMLAASLPKGVRLARVTVCEAPGCAATYMG